MAKYRGQLGCARRGKYTHKELFGDFDDEAYRSRWNPDKFSDSPLWDLDQYLKRAGKRVHLCNDFSFPLDKPLAQRRSKWTNMYHVAGATIKASLYRRPVNLCYNEIEARIRVSIDSNSDVTDIVNKLLEKFPYLKEEKHIG